MTTVTWPQWPHLAERMKTGHYLWFNYIVEGVEDWTTGLGAYHGSLNALLLL